jgi:secretion/DNA translocation related TadE-like protein
VNRLSGERGSATVWVLGLSAVLTVLGLAVVLFGAAAVARHRAGSAADLAALAAAGRAVTGDPGACTTAAQVAAANGAEMTACTVDASAVVEVEVRVPVRLAVLGERSATARARAGPVPVGDDVSFDAGGASRTSAGEQVVVRSTDRHRAASESATRDRSPSAGDDVRLRLLVGFVVQRALGVRQLVEHHVEHPHRPRLVQRVVAVAALGRLHA